MCIVTLNGMALLYIFSTGLATSPSPASYTNTNDVNSAGNPNMVLIGSLVAVSCLVVGAVVGGVVFVRSRAGIQ